MEKNKKVLIGMSGGVDSTVSALLLKEQGYEVEGLYMKLHSNPGYHELHLQRAKKASDELGIKLHILDLQDVFEKEVFRPFIDTYAKGKTPNPCALCNRKLKFGEMIKFADKIGAYYLATGHYIKTDGKYFYQAQDDTKDQSYFLFYVQKEVLPRLLFPLGDRKKSEIKELASKIDGLQEYAIQKESTEICFVPTTYTDVLKDYVEVDKVGEVLDSDGKVVGEHKGYMHYTIGKRKGFTVNGALDPHYVLSMNPEKNQIIVGKKDELLCHKVVIDELNMFDDRVDFDTTVKLRYRTKSIECHLVIKDSKGYVELKDGVFGVATGQAAVFYDDDKLVGGGWITEV